MQRVRRGFLVIAAGVFVMTMAVAIAAPRVLRWRMEQCEYSAPQVLRKIDRAVKSYITENQSVPADLVKLRGRIPSALSCESTACKYRGYQFEYSVTDARGTHPHYSLTAQRVSHQGYSFYLDESGVLRCAWERRATSQDPPCS